VLPTQWKLQKVHRNTVEVDVRPWVAAYKDTPEVSWFNAKCETHYHVSRKGCLVGGWRTRHVFSFFRVAKVSYNGLGCVDLKIFFRFLLVVISMTSCFGEARRGI